METKGKLIHLLAVVMVILSFLNITLLILVFDRISQESHKKALAEFFEDYEFIIAE